MLSNREMNLLIKSTSARIARIFNKEHFMVVLAPIVIVFKLLSCVNQESMLFAERSGVWVRITCRALWQRSISSFSL